MDEYHMVWNQYVKLIVGFGDCYWSFFIQFFSLFEIDERYFPCFQKKV